MAPLLSNKELQRTSDGNAAGSPLNSVLCRQTDLGLRTATIELVTAAGRRRPATETNADHEPYGKPGDEWRARTTGSHRDGHDACR